MVPFAPHRRTASASASACVMSFIGFRATPEITLRGSYYARSFYNAAAWDNQAGVSIVWAKRWW